MGRWRKDENDGKGSDDNKTKHVIRSGVPVQRVKEEGEMENG